MWAGAQGSRERHCWGAGQEVTQAELPSTQLFTYAADLGVTIKTRAEAEFRLLSTVPWPKGVSHNLNGVAWRPGISMLTLQDICMSWIRAARCVPLGIYGLGGKKKTHLYDGEMLACSVHLSGRNCVFCVQSCTKGLSSFLSRRAAQGRLCFHSGRYCKLLKRYFKLRMWFPFE